MSAASLSLALVRAARRSVEEAARVANGSLAVAFRTIPREVDIFHDGVNVGTSSTPLSVARRDFPYPMTLRRLSHRDATVTLDEERKSAREPIVISIALESRPTFRSAIHNEISHNEISHNEISHNEI